MRLRSPLAALTAALLNTASRSQKNASESHSYSATHDEATGGILDEDLSSSMISEQLFDMEMMPTLRLVTKPLQPRSTPQSHDVLRDILDEDLDELDLDLDEDDMASIHSPLTPDDTTGPFLLTAFHPFSDNETSSSTFLSRLPESFDRAEDAGNVQDTPAYYAQNGSGQTEAVGDYRSSEIEMVKEYVRDLECGKLWEGTARQGLPPRKDRPQHILDEAPSKRPDEAPLNLLLIENRFAAAVNCAFKASGDTYQPFPAYRFPLERDPSFNVGVRTAESGSLHEIRIEHARAFRSRLLPFHPSN